MKAFKYNSLAAAIALVLSGCGGSDSGSDPSQNDDNTGSDSTSDESTQVQSSGVITGFGSIYINGVRYQTAGAEVEFEGEGLKTDADLRLGMRVEVEASRDGEERMAERVLFDRDLKGPVASVSANTDDPTLGSFSVLGQTVTVDANTVLSEDIDDVNADGEIDLRDLSVEQGRVVVEVSGFPTEDGYVATRVERLNNAGDDSDDDDNEAEVKGTIANLDTAAGSFQVRDLTVQYDASALDEDLAGAELEAGWFVEVEGQLQEDGSLLAEKIEREDDRLAGDDELEGEFEMEGVVLSVDTESQPNTITINGRTIPVADASALVDLVGSKVEIEGEFDGEGRVNLELDNERGGVRPERGNDIRVTDRVETVVDGEITTRMGVTITPTGTSRIEDDDAEDGDRLTPEAFLARLEAGDTIEARGRHDEDGSTIWTRVTREDDEDEECSLRGPVDEGSIDASAGVFTVLGVEIDTASLTSDESFETEAGPGRAAFFTGLAAGTVIKAESEGCSPGQLVAGEVAYDAEDDLTFGSRDDDDDTSEDAEEQEDDQA